MSTPASPPMPDLAGFTVVPPKKQITADDFLLPDGTPMGGPDGLIAPPARQFATVYNPGNRVFSYRFDEAMRDSFVQARAMRRDAFLRGLFEERILPTINRDWQLEVDDADDPNQRKVLEGLTEVLKAIPDFDAFKRALLDGVWFGRAGCQWAYARDPMIGNKWGVPKWDPVHGDSVQFTFDGVPAILLDSMTVAWYQNHGATWGVDGDLRPTDRGGTALVLQRPYWRDRFAIHVHMREKADYLEGELAGSVQGLGLRGLVYWHYVMRNDALSWMIGYMQAVGQMDLLIFNYPTGDAAAEQRQRQNANKIIGKAAIVCPRDPRGNWPAVEQIQLNSAGLKALMELEADYFDRHIERLFVGQSMSAGADKGTGLGGTGRAEFCRATKDEILVYDTTRLDQTITNDLLKPLLKYNYPWAKFPVRYKSVLPDTKAQEKVQSGRMLVQMGAPIKLDEYRNAGGFSKPKEGDEIIAMLPGAPAPMVCVMGKMGPEPPPTMGGPVPMSALPPGAVPPPQSVPALNTPPPEVGPHGGPNPAYGYAELNPTMAQLPPGPSPLYPQAAPTANDGGGAPAAGPAMGYPGASNTFTPGFGTGRNHRWPTHLQRNAAPTRYSDMQTVRQMLRRLRTDPYEDVAHGAFADALEETHPGTPLAPLIRAMYGFDPSGVRRENNWYEPFYNSWDGTFPYFAPIGTHGPFNLFLGHEGTPEHQGENQRWVVHAVSRFPETRDSAYTLEFPHEEAHLIPAMFPGAARHIDHDELMRAWARRNGADVARGRDIEAAAFDEQMRRRELGDNA